MEGWATEQHENVAVVTFVHPPENLLGFRYLAELDQILVDLSDELSIRMIVITGGVEGFFVGHADLGDVEALMQGRKGAGEPDWWNLTLERISSISQPVVAAVNGQAWGGGCELALACQMRVASQSAHFRFVEVGAGAIPGAGGTQRLPRLLGPSAAARMIMSGETVDAQQALALGLVNAVLPHDDFIRHVLDWSAPIAAQPRHSLVAVKRALLDGIRMPLSEGLAYEQRLFRSTLRSAEFQAMRETDHS